MQLSIEVGISLLDCLWLSPLDSVHTVLAELVEVGVELLIEVRLVQFVALRHEVCLVLQTGLDVVEVAETALGLRLAFILLLVLCLQWFRLRCSRLSERSTAVVSYLFVFVDQVIEYP